LTASPAYDVLGRGYGLIRRPDPRLAEPIWSALGDAESVVNVGAGTGSYEPEDRPVIAVEPSAVMIAQRPSRLSRAVQGQAEALPLADDTVDAAMAVLSMQHWDDVELGLGEMLRVARRRLVLVTMDVEVLSQLWLVRDYVPETIEAHARAFPPIDRLLDILPGANAEPLPVPHDCTDGFMVAYWSRPESYLDPDLRAGTSVWRQLPPGVALRALSQLTADLHGGDWDHRYGQLRRQSSLDVGLRLVRAELSPRASGLGR
jgi:SAM-dependent methyltransferase